MSKEQLVKRSRKLAFMDVSTTTIANFLRMTKFTEISKSKNPTEYSRTYVDEDGETTDVTGYSEEISYNFDQHVGNLVHKKLADIADDEKTDSDALVDILQVDLTEPTQGGYKARLRTYSTVPDADGDSTDAYTYSGTFRKNSNMTIGVAKLSSDGKTATFTPSEEVPEYPVSFVVKDVSSEQPIEGAKITIDGVSYLTDATGIAIVILDADTYTNITVEKEGYTTQSDVSVTNTSGAILKEIELVEA